MPALASLAAALVLLLAVLIVVGTRIVRSRRATAPVTEAEARAHALPLTKSILSVSPLSRDRDEIGLDA
jgi:hypothetical protein